jgi:signal transduction histidine kinase
MADGGGADLAVLVHEVRSPVAALSAIAESAVEPGLDAEARTALVRLAVAACAGIERLLEDGALILRPAPVDLGALVADAVAAARLGGADVQATIAPDLPRLDVDALRLRQALDNLLVNAATHGDGAEVVVSAMRDGEAVCVSVADAGPGIPDHERTRIFESGVRLDDRLPGSGLGLAVSRTIVERHGGSLDVSSSPGRGATFTIELPIHGPD